MTRFLLPALSLLAPALLHAQEAPPNCTAPEHHQFDFWVGEWTVTAGGRTAGENTITSILNGCALREEWVGARGYSGTSINFYDRAGGRWHQTWIGSDGQPLFLAGGLDEEGRMVLASEERDGAMERITWTPNGDGTVRQHWERTGDGGTTWTTVFDGTYARKGDASP